MKDKGPDCTDSTEYAQSGKYFGQLKLEQLVLRWIQCQVEGPNKLSAKLKQLSIT